MIDYQKIFLAFLHENKIPSNETFLMGISGGVDSMSLLHISQTINLFCNNFPASLTIIIWRSRPKRIEPILTSKSI